MQTEEGYRFCKDCLELLLQQSNPVFPMNNAPMSKDNQVNVHVHGSLTLLASFFLPLIKTCIYLCDSPKCTCSIHACMYMYIHAHVSW